MPTKPSKKQKPSKKRNIKRRLLIRHGVGNKESRPIEWIWKDRIRTGTYVSLSGFQGTLKSSIALDISARYTTGRAIFPDTKASMPAGHVLYLYVEDNQETVDRHFLRAGGDASYWHKLPACTAAGDRLNVLEHLDEIEEVIREYGIRLVVIEGQNSVVGAPDISTDMKGRSNVTNKLHQFAQRLDIALIGIRNEDRKGRALGSQTMADISRCVLRCEELPPQKHWRKQRFLRLIFVKVSDSAPETHPPIHFSVENHGADHREIRWGAKPPTKETLEKRIQKQKRRAKR